MAPPSRAHACPCRFETDQTFSQVQETQIQAVSLTDGAWYLRVLGDYAGRVSGGVYDAANASAPVALPVQVRGMQGVGWCHAARMSCICRVRGG